MERHYKKSLFIFRRDLRLNDNKGLLAASRQSNSVLTCFIADNRQTGSTNKYRSLNALQFMCSALNGLKDQIEQTGGHLYILEGLPHECVKTIIEQTNIEAIFVNRDYTPFSIKRDEEIRKVCLHYNIDYIECHDLLINEPEGIETHNHTPYSIFTPFFRRAIQIPLEPPSFTQIANWDTSNYNLKTINISSIQGTYHNDNLFVEGTQANALKIVNSLDTFGNYASTRDYPNHPTTHLSAYLKFGLISIRTAFHAIINELGVANPLLRQLYWRDFFTHVAYFSPFVFGNPFKEKYNNISWSSNRTHFEAWCNGMTGFPIIDAGMRQLNQTGYMHNRVRLLTASFLVKDLHIDWRKGEQYFAQKLVDYDPSVNNGNWQWVAGTGTDASPYFRIFNPWIGQKQFDPEATYIYHFIPELARVSPHIIHTWFRHSNKALNYPQPIVDHSRESKITNSMYQSLD